MKGVKREVTPHGNTYQRNCTCHPTIIVGGLFSPCGGGKAALFELGSLCVLQNLVPYVWELIFPQVPIKWREIYTDVHSLLDVPCDSQSTMVKHSGLTRCPVELLWWWMGDRALRCSLSLSQKVLLDSVIYSSRQFICGQLNL